MPLIRNKPRRAHRKGHHSDSDDSTPICRCRVLYLGSAVPHITKDGLQGIQEPLKELYPDTGLSSLKGIDSWLSVWSNGLLLENVDEKNTKITRFYPIESLHYCAAVRNVIVPASREDSNASSHEKVQKFLPLDSPFAQLPNLNHPPLFACILRRTTGIKVLECHVFICKREMAANALVRCCFHAYADSTYAKQLEHGGEGTLLTSGMTNGTNGYANKANGNGLMTNGGYKSSSSEKSSSMQRSVTPLSSSIEKVNGWRAGAASSQNGDSDILVLNSTDEDLTDGPTSTSTPRTRGRHNYEYGTIFPDDDEIYEDEENHKVWAGNGNGSINGHNGASSEVLYLEPDGTLKSLKSHTTSILSRPRQFISTPPPPPPPPMFAIMKNPMDEDASSSTSKKKLKKKNKKQEKMQELLHPLVRPASMMNLTSYQGYGPPPLSLPQRAGSVMNGPVSSQLQQRPGSAMSTLTRPRPQLVQFPPQSYGNGYPGMISQPIYAPIPHQFAIAQQPHPQLVKGVKQKKNKNSKQILTPVPILAPNPMMPRMQLRHGPPGPVAVQPHPQMFNGREPNMRCSGGGPPHRPELVYMPMPGQYATIERGYRYHPRPCNMMNGDSSGTLVSQNGHGKLSKSPHESSSPGEGLDDDDSPFNTGIYRKKGHINERAFSYSIRQEQRSRSYGSLANLQFTNGNGDHANGSNGYMKKSSVSPPNRQQSSSCGSSNNPHGIKKEREIMQMVRDLDLNGDEIRRVPDIYPSNGHGNGHGQPSNKPIKQMNGYSSRKQNGHGPGNGHGPVPLRITHR